MASVELQCSLAPALVQCKQLEMRLLILRIKKEFGSGLCFQVFNMVQTYINIFYFVQTVKVTGLA